MAETQKELQKPEKCSRNSKNVAETQKEWQKPEKCGRNSKKMAETPNMWHKLPNVAETLGKWQR